MYIYSSVIKVYIKHSMLYLEIYNDLIFDLLATLPHDNIGDSVTTEQPKPLNIAEVTLTIVFFTFVGT